jgi:hypothetical protein
MRAQVVYAVNGIILHDKENKMSLGVFPVEEYWRGEGAELFRQDTVTTDDRDAVNADSNAHDYVHGKVSDCGQFEAERSVPAS